MATVEYQRPKGDTINVEVVDYRMNDAGALILLFEDKTQTLLSPQTEWVVRDE